MRFTISGQDGVPCLNPAFRLPVIEHAYAVGNDVDLILFEVFVDTDARTRRQGEFGAQSRLGCHLIRREKGLNCDLPVTATHVGSCFGFHIR